MLSKENLIKLYRFILPNFIQVKDEGLQILAEHSIAVTQKALTAAFNKPLGEVDIKAVYEGALFHDIGIFLTHAPEIGCFGQASYLCHGVLGSELLRNKGLFLSAKICESHIGVCLTKSEVIKNKLPLPQRDYFPESTEEKMVAWADKFYSKNPQSLGHEKSVEDVCHGLSKYGEEKIRIFLEWDRVFSN